MHMSFADALLLPPRAPTVQLQLYLTHAAGPTNRLRPPCRADSGSPYILRHGLQQQRSTEHALVCWARPAWLTSVRFVAECRWVLETGP